MKTLDLKSLIIGVLITMVIVTFMLLATTSGTPRAWEYKNVTSIARGNDAADAEIRKLGDEGWEVVGYAFGKSSGQNPDYCYYVLKRPKLSNWNWMFWK